MDVRSSPGPSPALGSEASPKLELPAYLDSTMLSTWRSCRRKYFWQVLHQLSSSSRSIHLVAGGAFAAGMEAARRLAFDGSRVRRASHDDLLEAAYPAFAREWGDYPIEEDHNKSFFNTFQGLANYLLQYPPQEDPVQPLKRPDGSPAVEFTFAIPLHEAPPHPETREPFLFVGRFDMLGNYNELPCIVDEKTTSYIGTQWANGWRLRGQFMGYIWACQQLGYELDVAVIRGIGLLKRDYPIATGIEKYPRYLIERWYRQLIMDLNGIIDAYVHLTEINPNPDKSYPYNFSDACSAYAGCPYVDLCSAGTPENFFGAYVRRLWNPLAKDPTKEGSENGI